MNALHRIYPSLLALLLLVVVTGCDLQEAEDAFDEVDVIIALEDINTTVVGTVIDAATGMFVRTGVQLTFVGPNSGNLVDIYSDSFEARTINDGVTAFGVENSVVPSQGNPVSFRVIANKDGYETGTANVTITETGQHSFRITMIPENTTVSGTEKSSGASQTSGSGASNNAVTVATPQTTGTTTTSTTVTVPAGTRATTTGGNALTGTVTTNVNYFPPTSSTANQAFPGGMTNVTVMGGAGGTRTTTVATAGFVNVTVTNGSGSKANSISQPLAVTMEVPNEIIRAGKSGRVTTFDVVRFNRATGEWEVIAENVTADANGSVSFSATQTGIFALFPALQSLPTCSMTYAVNRNGNSGPFNLVVTSPLGFYAKLVFPSGLNSFVVGDVPALPLGYQLQVDGQAVSTQTGFCNGGAGGNQTVTFDLPTTGNIIDFTLVGRAQGCTSINVSGEIPGFTIFYKTAGAPDDDARIIADSDITFNYLNPVRRLRVESVTAAIRSVERNSQLEFFGIFDSERQDFSEMITVPAQPNATLERAFSGFQDNDTLCNK